MSGATIKGTLTQGQNRPQKRKTQLGNRAHSANCLIIVYSHDEPRRAVFLQSEREERLLDGDPGKEEATNDDNSIVTMHPNTMELLLLSHSTQILSRSPKRSNPHSAHDPAPRYGPSEASPRTRRAISASLEASPPRPSTAHHSSASLEGRRPTLGE